MTDNEWIKKIVPAEQVEQIEKTGMRTEMMMMLDEVRGSTIGVQLAMFHTQQHAIMLVRAAKKISDGEANEAEATVMSRFLQNYCRMLYASLRESGIDPFED